MFRRLQPWRHATSIFDLTGDLLKRHGVRGLILDLDNTLVEWGKSDIRPELVKWIESLKSQGFKLCILSNGVPSRVRDISDKLGILPIPRAIKPRRGAFAKALKLLGTGCDDTVVVGDQLFTDVLGGNRCRLRTILIPPLSEREFIYTRLVRRIERLVLKRMKWMEKW